MMTFHTGATISPMKSFARTSSTATVKRFAAKLRRIRWRIYQTIQLRKRRVKKTLNYYKNQVDKFLSAFSSKLKPKEVFIWTNKVAKTSTDVLVFLSKAQHVNKVNVKSPSCLECADKLDSVLLMLSTVLHWVRTQNVGKNDPEESDYKKDSIEDDEDAAAEETAVQEDAASRVAEEAAADEATVAQAAEEAAAAKAAAAKAVEEAAAVKAAEEAAAAKEAEAAAATKAAEEAVVATVRTKRCPVATGIKVRECCPVATHDEEKQPAARSAPVQPKQPIDFSALWDEYYRSLGNKK